MISTPRSNVLRRNEHPAHYRCDAGFSLVEVMVAMFVLTLVALSTIMALTFTKFTAQNTLYELTALNMGLSIIEQMKAAEYSDLVNPPIVNGQEIFTMLTGDGEENDLDLGVSNDLEVPIVTEAGDDNNRFLQTTVTPSIIEMTDGGGVWVEVRYSYKHPRTGRDPERSVKNAITNIKSL